MIKKNLIKNLTRQPSALNFFHENTDVGFYLKFTDLLSLQMINFVTTKPPQVMYSMSKTGFRDINNARVSSRFKQVIVLIVAILIGIIVSIAAEAQGSYKKSNSRYFKSHYKSQIVLYANACTLLDKKRNQKPKSHFFSWGHKSKQKPQTEPGPTTTLRVAAKPQPVKPKPEVKPTPPKENIEDAKEDVVLAENNLPKPSSEKHEQIRKQVADNLKNKKDNEPIELAPLYFNFNEDEFSVVDMDPFLVAVEYALQGRTILIEGHTDSRGNDTYNVQLSIKRVQKIRELMHDMGVPDDRISVIGYGEEVAKHDNTSEQGRQMNRRVDFKAF